MKMKAAVVRQATDPYKFEEVELAEPKNDEVLVRITASGLCHTDEFGRTLGMSPIVLGHEGAGIIEKLGENVKDFAVGDHVAFSYAFCGHCKSCVQGRPQYCEKFNKINFGGVGADGQSKLSQNGQPVAMFFGQSSFAQYATISEESIVKIDEDVDLAMIAPFGCGAVGFSAIMAAKVAGCRQIIAVGGNEHSLALAKELGATDVINRKQLPAGQTMAQAVQAISNGGVNYAIDTSGNGNMIQNAIQSTCLNGKIVLLAPSGEVENFDFGKDVLMAYRTVIGCCEGDSNPKIFIPRLVQLYKEGRFPIDKIITKYPFEQLEQAREDSNAGKVIKAVVTME